MPVGSEHPANTHITLLRFRTRLDKPINKTCIGSTHHSDPLCNRVDLYPVGMIPDFGIVREVCRLVTFVSKIIQET
jgi:hypothetical protein